VPCPLVDPVKPIPSRNRAFDVRLATVRHPSIALAVEQKRAKLTRVEVMIEIEEVILVEFETLRELPLDLPHTLEELVEHWRDFFEMVATRKLFLTPGK
jgi:hypothetical protein